MGERVEKFEAGSVTGSALDRSAFSPALSSREGNVSLSVWFFASQLPFGTSGLCAGLGRSFASEGVCRAGCDSRIFDSTFRAWWF